MGPPLPVLSVAGLEGHTSFTQTCWVQESWHSHGHTLSVCTSLSLHLVLLALCLSLCAKKLSHLQDGWYGAFRTAQAISHLQAALVAP